MKQQQIGVIPAVAWMAGQCQSTAANDHHPTKAHKINQLQVLGRRERVQKSGNHRKWQILTLYRWMLKEGCKDQKRIKYWFYGVPQKLTCCEEHADKGHGSELWGAHHKGKVGNSPTVKSTPTKGMAVSCEGPITREKLGTHPLWRPCQQRAWQWAVRGPSQEVGNSHPVKSI